MYVYKIAELLNSLNQAKKDGFEYVSLSFLEAEDDFPESIDLNYIHSQNDGETDSIDSITLPEDYCLPF